MTSVGRGWPGPASAPRPVRQRHHPEPILDLTLFASRSFTVSNFSGLAFFAGFAALGPNNVLFLRQAWGYDVLTAGLLSALAPATVAACAPLAGRVASRHGFRTYVIAGPILVAALCLTFALTFEQTPRPWLFVMLGQGIAVGIAAFIPVNSAAAVADLPPTRLSVGGAVNNTFRQIGSVLGIAMLVAAIGSPTTGRRTRRRPPAGLAPDRRHHAGGGRRQPPPDQRQRHNRPPARGQYPLTSAWPGSALHTDFMDSRADPPPPSAHRNGR